ncbi:MAG: ABC transporter substrate-binding protein [Crocinitomicaceae bacterium]
MEFRDHLDRRVLLENSPKRIVSLVPSQTELLFDLGLREEVVGITKFCVHPNEWFRTKQRIGGTKQLQIDKIRELEPDLIIANKEENNREDIEALAEEFPVWVSDVKTIEDARNLITDLGDLVSQRENAVALLKEFDAQFEKLNSQRTSGKKAIYLIWSNPNMVAGSDTFINAMMKVAGLENAIKEERYPELDSCDYETPDLVLLSSEPFPFKEKHVDEFLQMFPEADVKIVDGEMFSWYGSRLLKAPDYLLNLFQ